MSELVAMCMTAHQPDSLSEVQGAALLLGICFWVIIQLLIALQPPLNRSAGARSWGLEQKGAACIEGSPSMGKCQQRARSNASELHAIEYVHTVPAAKGLHTSQPQQLVWKGPALEYQQIACASFDLQAACSSSCAP